MSSRMGRLLFTKQKRWSRYMGTASAVAEEDGSSLPATAISGRGGVIAKRFYDTVRVKPADDSGGFLVTLDHRVLKTPAKRPMKLPTAGLAMAIAAEWEAQVTGITPFCMPLMKLAATAIDRVPHHRSSVISSLLKYLHTDSVCCREEPGPLAERQAKMWDPLLDWAEIRLGTRPIPSSSIFVGDQPEGVTKAVERSLKEISDWQLSAFDSLASSARSVIIAMAIMDNQISLEDAMKIIRVDEEFQLEEWGLVEGGHDIDISDLHVKISAASVFLRLLQG